MGGQREQVSIEGSDIERQSAASLHGIDVEGYLSGTADAANLGHRLNSTNLVVGIHDRDEDSLIGNGTAYVIRIDTPIIVNGQVGSFEAKTFQVLARMQYSVMLDWRGDEMIAFFL